MIEFVLELIEEASPVWCVGDCECKTCYTRWVGVVHKDRLDRLECYKCGAMTGEVIYLHDITKEDK